MKNLFLKILEKLGLLNEKYNYLLHLHISEYTHENLSEKKANETRMYKQYLKDRMS